MKNIKVLGTGCPKCKKTTARVEKAVAESGIDASVEKVEDIMEIMQYDVISTPAVVIDEKVAIAGRIPSKEELIELLKA